MSFDKKAFMKAQFEPRVEPVPVPDLKMFFSEGAEPAWIVRGLTGHELGRVNEAKEKNRNIEAILEAMVSDKAAEKAEAIKALIGLDSSTPADIVRRLEMLVIGSVDPAIDHEFAVKMCTHFPVEFMQLSNVITKLTGQGAQVKKKQMNSGPAPT
jgi:hypothetical protein